MDLLDRLLAHNTWATQRLIEAVADLSPEERRRSLPIGPGSVQATLEHVIGAMRRWADRIAGEPTRPRAGEDDGPPPADELTEALAAADCALVRAARTVVREDRLDEVMELVIDGYPEPFRFTRGTAIVHVVTHGAHHRAQVLNMLRQLGRTGPDLDAVEAELSGASPPTPADDER